MKSTFARQFALTSGMILLSFCILGGGFLGLINTYLLNEKERTLSTNANEIADLAVAYSTDSEMEGSWNLLMSLSLASRVSSTDSIITDEKGVVILCSCKQIPCRHIGEYVDNEFLKNVTANGEYYAAGTLTGIYQDQRYIYGKQIVSMKTGEVIGYVIVSSGISETRAFLTKFSNLFLSTAIFVLLISFMATLFIARRQAKPLKEMAEAARRFAHGDFNCRVRTYGREDEVGDLAVAFNNMAWSLEKSESMRREFIANISHELKTPMTTISGYVDGILDGTIPKEKEEQYLQVVSAEVKRLSRLVRKMLDVSQLQSEEMQTKRERFNLTEVMSQALLSFEHKINGKKLDVDLTLPEDPVYVMGDRDSIMQVLYNLLDNAIKFAYEGSVLGLHLNQKGNKAIVSVQNMGNDISPEEQSLIFDRFHKTDQSRSIDKDGVGLGLYIVKTILNNHNEDISVSSENKITTFQFTLSLAKKSDAKK